ncbi:MAG TPA: hypothetical protein VFO62_06720 [Candidatus Binatia bacterium]|nr:hypothetical protein [Candidatus Binatia bacterium]
MAVSVIAAAVSRAGAQPVDCNQLPAGITDCVRDADCLYWPNATGCDCGNGGIEIALNKKRLADLTAWQDACPPSGCLFFDNCRGYVGARCERGTCVLGSCGDGIVAPQEACDTGAASATCDADCTAPSCGDWAVNGAAGETCDDGNVADGDGCSSVCACDDGTDADGDGIGDGCDDCVATPDGAVLSVLGLKNIGTDPVAGDDGLGLKMEAALGLGVTFGDLDPVAHGIGLVLRRGSGASVLALAIPGGVFDGTVGWRANASGTVWSFLDKTSGPVATGVRKARILDRSSQAPGGVSVKISGRDGDYPVGAFDVPLHVTLVLGNGAGRCAERDHDRADCRVSAAGDGVKCRR